MELLQSSFTLTNKILVSLKNINFTASLLSVYNLTFVEHIHLL